MYICKIGCWRSTCTAIEYAWLGWEGDSKKRRKKIQKRNRPGCNRIPQYYLPAHPSSLHSRQFHYDANSDTFLLPAHTHLIGDLRVGVIIGLLRCNGQHGRVGLLGTLIILIGIVLIVPRQRRHIWHPAITKDLQFY